MCGIGGFFDSENNYTKQREYYIKVLERMNYIQKHRGPDEEGIFLAPHIGMAHVRLSIIDPEKGKQPFRYTSDGHTWTIIYNGELYNTSELREELIAKGWVFRTKSDTEVILVSYLEHGPEFVKKLNGIFAFAIWEPIEDQVYLYRDRSGVKPLFYKAEGTHIIFSSEIKGVLSYPGIKPILDKKGMNEIFGIGPAKTYGTGVFAGIDEVLPGHYLRFGKGGLVQKCYWSLVSMPHEDSFDKTVEKTTELVIDSIERQMVSDVPICTFLSGGLDSSLVSAVCARKLKEKGERLNTFSFDFINNDEYFKASSFQPTQDRPYVEQMVKYLDSNHMYLECTTLNQVELLKQSVDARDLPAMADVDSSLHYFCSQVSKYNKVALTGECADEIFGGYPWFHKEECFHAHTFPWTMDLEARKVLLRDEFVEYLNMEEYVTEVYEKSVAETPRLKEDSEEEARRREISYLNQKWFMQTLLDRMDRASMYSGLEARVPYADHRILEYVWNIPWDIKCHAGVVKSLLRECGKNYLPEEILYRRKSPYPKTYDKQYEQLLAEEMRKIVQNSSSPVLKFIDPQKLENFLLSPSDYGKPWYGQLMAGPQLLAYMYQVNYWMEKYKIELQW
ncbi:MAG: asparagine synthase (glutamine-hydrolyzing) [Clostridiales bacterium]|nr:asparagine synthase (glutamine-hydrolyzing) [Clostridiales bacterium]